MADLLTPVDAVNLFVSNLQKKQRNLGKRKSKLDHYKETLSKGESLNEEQKKAVEGYDSVIQSIAVVQELILQSKDLLADVEKTSQHCETQAELSREHHTLNFLCIQICLMQLINGLDNADLRTAITKASSANHLRMLDTIKNLFVSPVIVNWPGTNSACLSSAPEFLQEQACLGVPAQHLYNFVQGRPVQIPIPEGYDGPLRKFNFKEARALCFRLLANPTIQRALGAPCPTNEQRTTNEDIKVNSNLVDHIANYNMQSLAAYNVSHSDRTLVSSSVEPDVTTKIAEQPPQKSDSDRTVRPPGSSFNFIQASKILNPDQSVDFSSNRTKVHLADHPIGDIAHSTSLPSQSVDLISIPYVTSYDNNENTYCLQPSDVRDDSKPYTSSADSARSIPASDAEVESNASIPSKPMSFADLFRRQSHDTQINDRRELIGSAKTNRVSTVAGRETNYFPSNADIAGHLRQSGTNRARGGRGFSTRGFGRGSVAPIRRPYGGPRISRGGAHPGRGRTFQGPRTNVAQA